MVVIVMVLEVHLCGPIRKKWCRRGRSARECGPGQREGVDAEYGPALLEDGEAPAGLVAIGTDVQLADAAPEDAVVRERAPRTRDLHGTAQRRRFEVGEHAERDFAQEDAERFELTQVRKRDSPIPNLTSTQRSPCSH
jgi:hypothetical protein